MNKYSPFIYGHVEVEVGHIYCVCCTPFSTPALLTKMFNPPNSSQPRRLHCSPVSLLTSPEKALAMPLGFNILDGLSSFLVTSRSSNFTTLFANNLAVARPIPDDAPVIRAPLREPCCCMICVGSLRFFRCRRFDPGAAFPIVSKAKKVWEDERWCHYDMTLLVLLLLI